MKTILLFLVMAVPKQACIDDFNAHFTKVCDNGYCWWSSKVGISIASSAPEIHFVSVEQSSGTHKSDSCFDYYTVAVPAIGGGEK